MTVIVKAHGPSDVYVLHPPGQDGRRFVLRLHGEVTAMDFPAGGERAEDDVLAGGAITVDAVYRQRQEVRVGVSLRGDRHVPAHTLAEEMAVAVLSGEMAHGRELADLLVDEVPRRQGGKMLSYEELRARLRDVTALLERTERERAAEEAEVMRLLDHWPDGLPLPPGYEDDDDDLDLDDEYEENHPNTI